MVWVSLSMYCLLFLVSSMKMSNLYYFISLRQIVVIRFLTLLFQILYLDEVSNLTLKGLGDISLKTPHASNMSDSASSTDRKTGFFFFISNSSK